MFDIIAMYPTFQLSDLIQGQVNTEIPDFFSFKDQQRKLFKNLKVCSFFWNIKKRKKKKKICG